MNQNRDSTLKALNVKQQPKQAKCKDTQKDNLSNLKMALGNHMFVFISVKYRAIVKLMLVSSKGDWYMSIYLKALQKILLFYWCFIEL